LTALTLLLGIVCRFNFGKGLPHYRTCLLPLMSALSYVVSRVHSQE
jgi:hypothetical protein